MRHLAACLLAAAALTPACAQTNAGEEGLSAEKPFVTTTVASFDFPWKLAFLPDQRMLVTEKPGALWLVTKAGAKTKIEGVPAVTYQGQQGLLGVYASPTFAADSGVYLTYAEPGEGGSGLALAWAKLVIGDGSARLDGLKVIWRDLPRGAGGQLGGVIAFAPDKKSLFLTVGERQRMTPAQDPNSPLGKILHLTLDGKPAPGNPGAGKTGTPTRTLLTPPKNTDVAKTAPAQQVALPGPNLAPAEIWASGIRTPYGLAFDSRGRLWEVEHGPRGGDELNLIEKGKNYGWPLVSYGVNYDGTPIANPSTRPDLARPVLYWVPVIAPGGLTFYEGSLFPQWKGSAFIGGLVGTGIVRIAFDAKGGARQADRWNLGQRIRDVATGPDGALWVLEDRKGGGLVRLTPKP